MNANELMRAAYIVFSESSVLWQDSDSDFSNQDLLFVARFDCLIILPETLHVDALDILLHGLCGVHREQLRIHELGLKSLPKPWDCSLRDSALMRS
ncbi:hypothetical protein F0562_035956 [Nyssa sinensis]|uniref:Uncharacterized protein n=1 Tax=Nyssa sinensis TaxID=561372 RepID=A0A5J5AHI2_9ASTE|nr:hypothetical protein F0562_035956 [Nyssa sinensis]